jgi:APA family basic amino acid/polyamine antiporter
VLTAAGLVFFAFLGFSSVSRDASAPAGSAVGEERGPAVPRLAVSLVLLIPLVSYLLVAAALMHTLDLSRLAMESAPLVAGVGGADAPALGVLVRVAAAAATTCALFAALGGVGRTAADMAAYRDLPSCLGAPGARGGRWFSGLLGVAGAVLVVVLANPVAAVAITACCGLVYYAMVNLAALRLPAAQRRWPKWTSALGLPLCLGLAVLLPRTQVVIVGLMLVVGFVICTLLYRRRTLGAGSPGAVPPPRRDGGRATRGDLRAATPGERVAGPGGRGVGGAAVNDDGRVPRPGQPRERPLEGSAGVAPDGGNGC